jgi:tetratricopeptide (TPR) repeat protein
MSRVRLIALLLGLITLVIYLPATRHDFQSYDDDDYVTGNPVVQQGLTFAGVRWAFTTFHAANWHPLTWLSHMADCEFFGLNPGAHHFINVLFHAVNAALLFVLLWRLTEGTWRSALVAALFAWHPLHVESVAWIAERKDVLSSFFALLTLLNYARFVRTKSIRYYSLAVFCFAFGLLAKPILVTLPFVMLLLDFWPTRRFALDSFRWPLAREKIPFFLLAAASCLMTWPAQNSWGAVVSLQLLPFHYRLENAAVALAGYLVKLLWPVNLAVIYPFEPNSRAVIVASVAVLVLISTGVWLERDRRPCWLMGWLWFLGMLVPVSGLVQVGGTVMADRYTYLPSIGVFMAMAFGLSAPGWAKKYAFFGAALLLLACVLCAERQLGYWRDSETLFRHTLAITRRNEFAHLNLGVALERQGRTGEALAEYREGARLNPGHYYNHFVIGNLLLKTGEPAAALAEYRECLDREPNSAAFHSAAGCALAALDQREAALQEFDSARKLDPNFAVPHLELAQIFFAQGRDDRAVEELRSALQATPDDVETLAAAAHFLAANQNAAARDGQTARVLALKANDLSGGRRPDVCDTLGMALAETGDFTNAATCAQNALELATAANLKNVGLIRRRLELYQRNLPWRESFRATNAPPKAGAVK